MASRAGSHPLGSPQARSAAGRTGCRGARVVLIGFTVYRDPAISPARGCPQDRTTNSYPGLTREAAPEKRDGRSPARTTQDTSGRASTPRSSLRRPPLGARLVMCYGVPVWACDARPDIHCASLKPSRRKLSLVPRNLPRDARLAVVATPSLLFGLIPLVIAAVVAALWDQGGNRLRQALPQSGPVPVLALRIRVSLFPTRRIGRTTSQRPSAYHRPQLLGLQQAGGRLGLSATTSRLTFHAVMRRRCVRGH